MPAYSAVVLCTFETPKGKRRTERRKLYFEHPQTSMIDGSREVMDYAQALADSSASCSMKWLGFECLTVAPMHLPFELTGGLIQHLTAVPVGGRSE